MWLTMLLIYPVYLKLSPPVQPNFYLLEPLYLSFRNTRIPMPLHPITRISTIHSYWLAKDIDA